MAALPAPELSESVLNRFHSQRECAGANECWLWRGQRSPSHYGLLGIGKRKYAAHRIAYFIATGKWPGELFVCHHCDNPPCCNPAHLFLGTTQDNTADRLRKGRTLQRRGVLNPRAKLTPEQVREIRAAKGVPTRELSRRYGIVTRHVRDILNGVHWSHVR